MVRDEGSSQKGQTGNPPSRPTGSQTKISDHFLMDLGKAWEKHGKKALEQMIEDEPTDFVRMMAQLIPKDIHIRQGTVDRQQISIALDPDGALTKRFQEPGVDFGVPVLAQATTEDR